jgi:hypothetical protein
MIKRVAVLGAAALAVAAGGVAQARSGHAHPVPYLFAGTVVSTTAADPTAVPPVPATVTVMIKRANRHGKAFRGQNVTFTITDKTRIWKRGVASPAVGDLAMGDRVHIKAWGPRNAGPTFAFQARWIHDFGPKPPAPAA